MNLNLISCMFATAVVVVVFGLGHGPKNDWILHAEPAPHDVTVGK